MLTEEQISYSDLIRNFFAKRPRDVDGVANTSAQYYRVKLLRYVFARFRWGGIPEENGIPKWDINYMFRALFLDGLFTITDTDMGVLPLKCGISGINVFQMPTTAIIANPVLGSLRRTIDVDCAVVRLQYNYHGIIPVLNRYAALLAMCDSGIAVNLLNSKVAFVGFAGSKAQAKTMQKMYDEIAMGNPAVFVKSDVVNGESFIFNRVKENFIAPDIQRLKREIINEFLTEIGINNANLDKRERLNLEEVRANDEEIGVSVSDWIRNVNEGLAVANSLYNMNLSFSKVSFSEGAKDESSKSDKLLPGTESPFTA